MTTMQSNDAGICCLHRIGKERAKYIHLHNKTKVKVGRSIVNDIQLDESQLISREHILLAKNAESEKWSITDLASSNGLFINGARIKAKRPYTLAEGDLVELGRDGINAAVYRYKFHNNLHVKQNRCVDPQTNDTQYLADSDEEEAVPFKRPRIENGESTSNNNRRLSASDLLRQKMAEHEKLLKAQYADKEREIAEKMEEMKQKQLAIEQENEAKRQELEEHKMKLASAQSEREEQQQKEKAELEEQLKSELQNKLQEQEDALKAQLEQEITSIQTEKEKEFSKKFQEQQEKFDRVQTEQDRKCENLTDLLEAKELQQATLEKEQQRAADKINAIQEQQQKEKEKLEEQLHFELQNKLQEQEDALKAQLEQEIKSLQTEKQKVEKSLQKELEQVVQEKDRHLEDKLREQQQHLQKELYSKENEQKQLQKQLETTRAEIEQEKRSGAEMKKQLVSNMENLMEEELICCICDELFIQAMSLNCSHSFCALCISKWMVRKRECPNCRAAITYSVRSLVLDSYINRMVELLGEESKQKRNVLCAERKKELAAFELTPQGQALKRQQDMQQILQQGAPPAPQGIPGVQVRPRPQAQQRPQGRGQPRAAPAAQHRPVVMQTAPAHRQAPRQQPATQPPTAHRQAPRQQPANQPPTAHRQAPRQQPATQPPPAHRQAPRHQAPRQQPANQPPRPVAPRQHGTRGNMARNNAAAANTFNPAEVRDIVGMLQSDMTRTMQALHQPGVAQPAVAQPGVVQPGVAQPGVAQPGHSANAANNNRVWR